MESRYIGAIDQGTTSTRFVLVTHAGKIAASHQIEHRQIYPQPGWVEHDPLQIWECTSEAISHTLKRSGISASRIAAIGVTNQRETTVAWSRVTGKPYHNALVWQDTRTAELCARLARSGGIDRFRGITGLPLASYFSGPKIAWLLEHCPQFYKDAQNGDALAGTIDSWIIWNLTGGRAGGVHVTDPSNASRTLLFNIERLAWDGGIAKEFGIPISILPPVRPSSDAQVYGLTTIDGPFGARIPICGDLGDQQAALFGQACFSAGEAKNTYGTGCFLLMNTGENAVSSRHGLITAVAYQIGNARPSYALEGSVAVAGSLVQWARDRLGLISSAAQINELAASVADNGGVYCVPAFAGLFAPYWQPDARGIIAGLTHFAGKGHIARAILEATAFQTREIFDAMVKDSGIKLTALKADGGMIASELLMQFQADILNVPVICPQIAETTAIGAAYAAGLAVAFWKDIDELRSNWTKRREWMPAMSPGRRNELICFWQKAVARSQGWLSQTGHSDG